MTDNDIDPEELLQEQKDKRRHSSEPADAGDEDDVDDPLVDEILAAYDDLDAGELSTQVQTRDEDLAAVLEGLDRQPLDRDRVLEGAADELDVDAPDDPTKADVVRLLVRVGLRYADEDAVEAARAAKRDRALEEAEGL